VHVSPSDSQFASATIGTGDKMTSRGCDGCSALPDDFDLFRRLSSDSPQAQISVPCHLHLTSASHYGFQASDFSPSQPPRISFLVLLQLLLVYFPHSRLLLVILSKLDTRLHSFPRPPILIQVSTRSALRFYCGVRGSLTITSILNLPFPSPGPSSPAPSLSSAHSPSPASPFSPPPR
jgi:hypothetical protein